MTIVLSDLRRDRIGAELETSIALRIGDDQHRFSIVHGGDFGSLADATPEFDPFLVFLLIPAMARNMPIVVEGSIDAQRLDGLRRGMQTLLAGASKDWHIVPISAEARTENRPPDLSKGAALGMSCGIDSLYAFEDLARDEIARHLRVKLLTHNDIGAHPNRATFERHRDHARRFATDVGLPLVTTSVDLSRYYGRRFIHSHSMRNAGAAISLEPLFHAFFYSKGDVGFAQARLGRAAGIGPMDPALLPLLNTSAHSYLSHGMHIDRLGKTDQVMRGPYARAHLTVCTHGFEDGRTKMNCGQCYKCARALFFADANGMLEDFSQTFDLTAFQANRAHGLRRILRHTVVNRKTREDQDMLAYLFEQDYPMPGWFRLFRKMAGRSSLAGAA
ncbi:hypothetical protein [Pontitalea aquivivens]|uniref:hypothetical protein n=1 Tax=Pontitalea aquivivens TaxID=3388663 RepID=UPI003970D59E